MIETPRIQVGHIPPLQSSCPYTPQRAERVGETWKAALEEEHQQLEEQIQELGLLEEQEKTEWQE